MSLSCGPGPGQGPLMRLLYVCWQGTVHFSTQLFFFIIFVSPFHQYRYRSPSRSEGGAFAQSSPAPQKQPVISALLNAECQRYNWSAELCENSYSSGGQRTVQYRNHRHEYDLLIPALSEWPGKWEEERVGGDKYSGR